MFEQLLKAQRQLERILESGVLSPLEAERTQIVIEDIKELIASHQTNNF